jgi:uncharacterized protein YuzB (UPF0349 family)
VIEFSGQLVIYFGDGAGNFAPVILSDPGSAKLSVADLDGDGRPDIILALESGIVVFRNLGGRQFQQLPELETGSTDWNFMVIGDFDGDGNLDVLVSGDVASGVARGNGHGGFSGFTPTQPSSFLEGRSVRLPGSAEDLLLVPSEGGLDLGGASALGAAHFLRWSVETGGWTVVGAVVAPGVAAGQFVDLDGDGEPDLVSASPTGAQIALISNTRCRPRRLAMLRQPSGCAQSGQKLETQPSIQILDDGGNLVTCAAAVVSAFASEPGEVIGGSTRKTAVGGIAQFSSLAILAGGLHAGFQFVADGLLETQSATVAVDASVEIAGPSHFSADAEGVFSSTQPLDAYEWSLDGSIAGSQAVLRLSQLAPGNHELVLTGRIGICEISASFRFNVGDRSAAGVTRATLPPVTGRK